jgi:hypothetical protein
LTWQKPPGTKIKSRPKPLTKTQFSVAGYDLPNGKTMKVGVTAANDEGESGPSTEMRAIVE